MTKLVLIAAWGLLAAGCYAGTILHYSALLAARVAFLAQ